MLTMEIYDQRITRREEEIAKQEKAIEQINVSKANFQEYMDVHASMWNEEKFIHMKTMLGKLNHAY